MPKLAASCFTRGWWPIWRRRYRHSSSWVFSPDGTARDNAFLLESVRGGEARGRLFDHRPEAGSGLALPGGQRPKINRTALSDAGKFTPPDSKTAASHLRALTREAAARPACRIAAHGDRPVRLSGLRPCAGAAQVEDLPNPPPDTLSLPDAILLRPTITAIFDSVKDEIIVITPVWFDTHVDTAYVPAAWRVEDGRSGGRTGAPAPPSTEVPTDLPTSVPISP